MRYLIFVQLIRIISRTPKNYSRIVVIARCSEAIFLHFREIASLPLAMTIPVRGITI